ncbi:MAG: IscS subfamily cysteine desulfurase [Bacteroidota bacterium]
MKNITKKAICGICPAGCWVKVTYGDDGKMVKVEEDDTSPLGAICKFGKHAPEIVYSENRLRYPMKRVGPKGDYKFERISWDEAYDIIVKKHFEIKENYGAEATAIYTGRGSFELALCDLFQPKDVAISSASSVLFPFGSPNTLGVGALCYVSFAMIAPHVTMGGMYHYMFPDTDNAEMVIIWGANPATDTPPNSYKKVLEAHGRGAKIVVIDPRKTAVAKLDGVDWLPLRPGTDGALALGLCNILIRQDLYNKSFVEEWTVGFENFSRYAQQFRPEVVEQITGVPAEKVEELAIAISELNGVAPLMYTGLEYTNSGVQNIRATFILWALAGQLDVPGGYCFAMQENQFQVNRDGLIPNPDETKALGRDRFPVYSQYRGESHAISLPESVLEGKPYKIRSLIIHGASIITAWPQPEIWKKTLNELDFVVTIDRQLTADAAYADIVLPATTMFEIQSYMKYGPLFRIREKVIDPVGEARNDFLIMAELAKRLGYGHLYPQTEDAVIEQALKGSGFSFDDLKENNGIIKQKTAPMEYKKWEKGKLRADKQLGFDTPSGKFEIESLILEEHGYDALPVYTDPVEGPVSQLSLTKKYPLVFNSGARVSTDFRSQHHGIQSLYKQRPEPTVTINTKDAKERDITNGELVYVITKRGKVKLRALVTEDIVQGAIDANMGGGTPVGPKSWQDCNINELTDLNNFDPISGFPVYKALLCDVQKVSGLSNKLFIDAGEIDADELKINIQEQPVKRIYLDNNATTPMSDEVKQVIINNIDKFGNPSSIYKEGKEAKKELEAARRKIAQLLNTTSRRITFTSGGSEANNYAIKGVAFQNFGGKNHIITSKIEHSSVINTCKWLEGIGFQVTYLDVDADGLVRKETLKKAITPETCLVSIMLANNETGSIQPIIDLVEIAHQHNIIFHTDAVQAIGKIPVNIQELGIDILSMSGHKLYAPKGVGALFIRSGLELEPLISGGKQEFSQRGGTENLLNIMALGKAAEMAIRDKDQLNELENNRDFLETEIIKLIPKIMVNSGKVERLPNTLSITFPDIRAESLLLEMDKQGVSFSSGSACRSGSPKPSYVLLSMGKSEDEAHRSARFSLGFGNTREDLIITINLLKKTLENATENIRFMACR